MCLSATGTSAGGHRSSPKQSHRNQLPTPRCCQARTTAAPVASCPGVASRPKARRSAWSSAADRSRASSTPPRRHSLSMVLLLRAQPFAPGLVRAAPRPPGQGRDRRRGRQPGRASRRHASIPGSPFAPWLRRNAGERTRRPEWRGPLPLAPSPPQGCAALARSPGRAPGCALAPPRRSGRRQGSRDARKGEGTPHRAGPASHEWSAGP